MKIKRLAPLVLLAPFALAACGSLPQLTLSANWYFNTRSSNISGTREELTYTVKFIPEETDGRLSVDYDVGSYTSLLLTETISLPENTVKQGYHLHTETTITGRYIFDGTRGSDFTDRVVSDVWFLDLTESLRPIRSLKTVYNTTPNPRAESVDKAGVLYNFSYEATYYETNKTVITVDDLTDSAPAQETKLSWKGGGTFLDNEEILFALRGLDLKSSFSFRTVNPTRRQVKTLSSLSTTAEAEAFPTNFSMKVGDGEPVQVTSVNASRVTVGYSGDNAGRSQTYVYACCEKPEQNTYRNVLLQMETYALNNLGTFRCELAEAVFNNK